MRTSQFGGLVLLFLAAFVCVDAQINCRHCSASMHIQTRMACCNAGRNTEGCCKVYALPNVPPYNQQNYGGADQNGMTMGGPSMMSPGMNAGQGMGPGNGAFGMPSGMGGPGMNGGQGMGPGNGGFGMPSGMGGPGMGGPGMGSPGLGGLGMGGPGMGVPGMGGPGMGGPGMGSPGMGGLNMGGPGMGGFNMGGPGMGGPSMG